MANPSNNSIELLVEVIDKATSELKKIRSEMGGFEEPAKKANSAFASIARTLAGYASAAAAIGLVTGAIRKTITETSQAQAAVAQLNAALESNGNVVGFTSKQLQDYASQLQRTTTFSDEAVISAQSLLLSFSNIRGDNFTRTTDAVVNLSARLGKDLSSSAILVGRALNDPVESLNALSRSGVKFTENQEKVIKSLVESGRLAEAQGIILDTLDQKFGNAAVAARNTLGGALDGLKNSFGELFEVSDESSSGAVASINALTLELQKPETINAVNGITSAFANLGAVSVSAIASLIKKLQELANSPALLAISRIGLLFGVAQQVLTPRGQVPTAPVATNARPISSDTQNQGADQTVKSAASLLKEIRVTATKIPVDAIKKLAEQTAASTRTVIEQELAAFYAFEAALESSLSDGEISQEQYIARFNERLTNLITDVEVTAKRIGPAVKQPLDGLNVFAEQAARNIQNAFANFLFDPFSEGLKGMLKGFVDLLRRMIAELLAQTLLLAFLDYLSGGVLGRTIATFAAAGAKEIRGPKAMGGPVSGGSTYLVGERGPELFTPGASGMITPNNRLGGSVTVAPVYNIDARGATQDLIKVLPAILEENTKRAVMLARRSIYDDISRGAVVGA